MHSLGENGEYQYTMYSINCYRKLNKVLTVVSFVFTVGGDFLIKLGKLLHISSSRNMILRAEVTPPIGVAVFSSDGRELGHVTDVFGPKSAPYVAVRPASELPVLQNLVGKVLFYGGRGEKNNRHVSSKSGDLKAMRGGR